MSITCTRCEGTGFLNADQIPANVFERGVEAILRWMTSPETDHDVTICDCCGDGDDWYGEPGEHYNAKDPQGPNGPYASNGGLCECH